MERAGASIQACLANLQNVGDGGYQRNVILSYLPVFVTVKC